MITENKTLYSYNNTYDILYLELSECYDSYGNEDIIGIVINHDYNTNEVVGADIWDFKKRMEKNEEIPLPFEVDLQEIYKEL
jgi:hypothetical protein